MWWSHWPGHTLEEPWKEVRSARKRLQREEAVRKERRQQQVGTEGQEMTGQACLSQERGQVGGDCSCPHGSLGKGGTQDPRLHLSHAGAPLLSQVVPHPGPLTRCLPSLLLFFAGT